MFGASAQGPFRHQEEDRAQEDREDKDRKRVAKCLQELGREVRRKWSDSIARTDTLRFRAMLSNALASLPPQQKRSTNKAPASQQPLFCVFISTPSAQKRRDEILASTLAELKRDRPGLAVLRGGLPFERSAACLEQELCRQARSLLRGKEQQRGVAVAPAGDDNRVEEEARGALEQALEQLRERGPVLLVCDGIEGFCDTADTRPARTALLGAAQVENRGAQYLQKHSIPSLLADTIAAPGTNRIACVATSAVLDVTSQFSDRVRSRDVKTVFLRPCSAAEARSGLLHCLLFAEKRAEEDADIAFKARWNEAVLRAASPQALDEMDVVANVLCNDAECVPRLVEMVIATVAADAALSATPLECVPAAAVLRDCARRYCTSLYVHRHIASSLSECEATVLVGLCCLAQPQTARYQQPQQQSQQQQQMQQQQASRPMCDRLLELFRTCGATSLPAQLRSPAGITLVLSRLLARGDITVRSGAARLRPGAGGDGDQAGVEAEDFAPVVCALPLTVLASVVMQLAKERRCGSLLKALLQRLPPVVLLQ